MDKRYWIQCGDIWINPDNVFSVIKVGTVYRVVSVGTEEDYISLTVAEAQPLLAFMHYFHFMG